MLWPHLSFKKTLKGRQGATILITKAAMPGQGHDQSHELRDLRWTQLLALKPQLLVAPWRSSVPTMVEDNRSKLELRLCP